MSSTTVVNVRKENYDVYIGRGSPFGNGHPIGNCVSCRTSHSRTDCINHYREDFALEVTINEHFRNQVLALKGKRLGCFCKPQACHGDVIVAWLENQEINRGF